MKSGEIISHLTNHLRDALRRLHREGYVVGLSGGIDSAVTAHLAVAALGPDRVLGVVMPERESSPDSETLASDLADALGIRRETVDITASLEGMQAYRTREDVVRRVLPGFDPVRHRVGIVLRQDMVRSSLPALHDLTAIDADGQTALQARLNKTDYTAFVAATNFKQRTRALHLYYFADRENYAVLGTTNRDESLLGFFVKLGDGAADVEAIEVLYKTEVYDLARALGIDPRIIARTPTTDTLPGQPSQRGYFYGMDFETIDAALAVLEGEKTEEEAAAQTDLTPNEVATLVKNLRRRNETTTILRTPPVGPRRSDILAMLE